MTYFVIFPIIIFSLQLSVSQNAPKQPLTGPGGNNYAHATYSFTKFGTDIYDCYWIMEPDDPRPDSAVVIVYWHGTNSNPTIDNVPAGHALTLEHICRKGYTVVYPLYQYGGLTLPFLEQLRNGANVVNLALTNLESGEGRVRPKRNHTGKILLGATGISRGGSMTMNIAGYHASLGLPSFEALCTVVPGAGQSMAGIDQNTKIIVLNGEENSTNFSESSELFNRLDHIPCTNKHLIQINSDNYGTPDLIAEHNFGGSGHDPADSTVLNALDYYGMWKFAVGVFDCVFKNIHCEYCFGTDSLVTYMGHWSDGIPVRPATIVDTCQYTNVAFETSQNRLSDIRIFPNPFQTSFSIHLPMSSQSFKVCLYNGVGQPIQIFENQYTVETNDLASGIYWLEITTDLEKKVLKIMKTE